MGITWGRVTSDAVSRCFNWASDRIDKGTCYQGMSYEEGVRDTIDWLTGETKTAPDEDDGS